MITIHTPITEPNVKTTVYDYLDTECKARHGDIADIIAISRLAQDYNNSNSSSSQRVLINEINLWNTNAQNIWNMNCLNITLSDVQFIITIRGVKRVRELGIALDYWRNVTMISRALLIISLDALNISMIDFIANNCDFTLCKLIVHPYGANVIFKYNIRPSIKHHYWWLINFIFRNVIPSYLPLFNMNHNQVLFFEEDHIVAKDILVVTKQMNNISLNHKLCDNRCMNLRYYYDKYERSLSANINGYYQIFKHGNQMAFNHFEFELLDKYHKFFCEFPDYNWDFTMMALRTSLYNNENMTYYTIQPMLIRSLHIGYCGGTHQSLDQIECNRKMNMAIYKMNNINRRIDKHGGDVIFKIDQGDAALRNIKRKQKLKQHKGYGRWLESDIKHCLEISNKSTHLII